MVLLEVEPETLTTPYVDVDPMERLDTSWATPTYRGHLSNTTADKSTFRPFKNI